MPLRSIRRYRPKVSEVVVISSSFNTPIFFNHVIDANNLGKPIVGVIFDIEMMLHEDH
jgi:acetoin utilization deacetylase AcuC-like enzyme